MFEETTEVFIDFLCYEDLCWISANQIMEKLCVYRYVQLRSPQFPAYKPKLPRSLRHR